MKSILTLVGMAISLDNYAKFLEAESAELDIAGFNVKRASLFLQKLQNDFTESIVPAGLDVEDANVLDFGIKIIELKEDIEAHVKSLDVANPNYTRLINNALSAIEEAELWFDEHIKSAIKDVEEVVQNIDYPDPEDSNPVKTEITASKSTESPTLLKDDLTENPDNGIKVEEVVVGSETKVEAISVESQQEADPQGLKEVKKKSDSKKA